MKYTLVAIQPSRFDFHCVALLVVVAVGVVGVATSLKGFNLILQNGVVLIFLAQPHIGHAGTNTNQ